MYQDTSWMCYGHRTIGSCANHVTGCILVQAVQRRQSANEIMLRRVIK